MPDKESHTTPPPKDISLAGFLNRLVALDAYSRDASLLFLLGSGASRPSGIKTGGEMVAEWIEMLRLEDKDHESIAKDAWATPERLNIKTFDARDPAASYPEMFARAYGERRAEGFDYLEREIAGREPSFGYSVLAQILTETRHRVVVTTNFDNLVTDALSIYTSGCAIVCGHESLAGFVRPRPTRPQVVKVHRDLFYEPRNTRDELAGVSPAYATALIKIFRAHVPVVIGYGGNDGSLMRVLEGLEPGDLPHTIYWCYLSDAGLPSTRILKLISRHGGRTVPIDGFDELMIDFQDLFRLAPLDEFLRRRGDERAIAYKSRRDRLGRSLLGPGPSLRSLQSVLRRGNNAQQLDSVAKLEPDRAKRARIYEQGLGEHPNDPWMAGYAALFYAADRATHERAEALHRKAIRFAPRDPSLLTNAARFLAMTVKRYDEAVGLYKRALDENPEHTNALACYGAFLSMIKSDHDKAERLYRRALDVDPRHFNTLCNLALLLTTVRESHDEAQEYAILAMEVEPNDANHLCNYASFLAGVRKQRGDAKDMLERARACDPDHPNVLSSCAQFFAAEPGKHEEAERLFRRAIQLYPGDASHLTNLADFLAARGGCGDEAEEHYDSALKCDPDCPSALRGYAQFLADNRTSYDRAEELFERLVRVDPENPDGLLTYAGFLETVKKDRERAALMRDRADASRRRRIGRECREIVSLE